MPPVDHTTLPPKYPRGTAIKAAKKTDLLKLLVYIPPVHRQYFTGNAGQGYEEDEEYIESRDSIMACEKV